MFAASAKNCINNNGNEEKRREEKRREEDLIEYRGVKEFKPDQYIKIMFRNFIIQFPNFIQVTRMCILPQIHH